MTFIEVAELPEKLKNKHGNKGMLKSKLDRFMSANIKMAKIVYDKSEYTNPMSCYNAFNIAVRRHVFPIDVHMRCGEVYLVRRDI